VNSEMHLEAVIRDIGDAHGGRDGVNSVMHLEAADESVGRYTWRP